MTLTATVARALRLSFATVKSGRDSFRMAMFRLVLKSAGNNCLISQGCSISRPDNLVLGSNVFVNRGCMLSAEGGLIIGSDCKIGPYTTIWTSNHGMAASGLIRSQADVVAPVTIGDDVWLGANVTVLPGVTIGSGAVIGAGAVVVGDIPGFAVAVGNPARVVRQRR